MGVLPDPTNSGICSALHNGSRFLAISLAMKRTNDVEMFRAPCGSHDHAGRTSNNASFRLAGNLQPSLDFMAAAAYPKHPIVRWGVLPKAPKEKQLYCHSRKETYNPQWKEL
jgi:hypothetical protein